MSNPASRPPLVLDPTQLQILRVRIGLDATDDTMDAEITSAWETTLSLLEAYLDRFLVPGTYIEVVTHKRGTSLNLKGYPVLQINAITDVSGVADAVDDTVLQQIHIDYSSGVLLFDRYIAEHQFTVNYDMLDPVVGALLYAARRVFDDVYSDMTSSGDQAVVGGTIKSISSDGAKVDFDVGSSASTGGGIDVASGLPSLIIGILESYRRYEC